MPEDIRINSDREQGNQTLGYVNGMNNSGE